MEPGLRGCPLAGVSGLFTFLHECFISWVQFWNAELRPPPVPVKPGSLGVPAAPSGRKLLGLVQDGCLLADHVGQTRAAAAQGRRKSQRGLQSQQTLIRTNTAMDRVLEQAKQRRLLTRVFPQAEWEMEWPGMRGLPHPQPEFPRARTETNPKPRTPFPFTGSVAKGRRRLPRRGGVWPGLSLKCSYQLSNPAGLPRPDLRKAKWGKEITRYLLF